MTAKSKAAFARRQRAIESAARDAIDELMWILRAGGSCIADEIHAKPLMRLVAKGLVAVMTVGAVKSAVLTAAGLRAALGIAELRDGTDMPEKIDLAPKAKSGPPMSALRYEQGFKATPAHRQMERLRARGEKK